MIVTIMDMDMAMDLVITNCNQESNRVENYILQKCDLNFGCTTLTCENILE